MKSLKKIHIKEKLIGQEVSYQRPVKFKGPWFGGVASELKLIVSGTRITKSSLDRESAVENYLKFTVYAYHTRLKRPDLIHLTFGDESFTCYEIYNDTYVATSSYTEKSVINSSMRETKTYSEKVRFAQLYFKVPAKIFRDHIIKDSFKIVLQFPKVEYRLRMKKSDRDYFEYVASICDNVAFPVDLHKEIAKKENSYNLYMNMVLYGGIIGSAVVLVGMTVVFNKYKIKGDCDFWIGVPTLTLLVLSCIVYYFLFKRKYGA